MFNLKFTPLLLVAVIIQFTYAQNGTLSGQFKYCEDHSYCSSNGICYQDTGNTQAKFCSCDEDYYGSTCKNKNDPLWQQLVIVLAVLCGLLFIALIIAAYLLLNQNKGNSKEYQSHGESWTAVRVSKQPTQTPMYSGPSLAGLEEGNNTLQNKNKFDIVDNGLNHKSNTFQSIAEYEEEKNSEKNSGENKESDSSEPPESVVNVSIPLVEKISTLVENTNQDDNQLTQENLDYYNRIDSTAAYGQARGNTLLPPTHVRYTSQDSNDMQSMDEIYRNMYASGNPYSPETRKISIGKHPGRGQMIPIETTQGMRGHGRQQHNHHNRPISPSSQASSRPSSRPMSPSSGIDMRLHPRSHGQYAQQGAGYNTTNHRQQKQRSPKQGQLGHRTDYTDARGRPRSMGDLQMLGAMEYRRNHRARSVDNLDAMSMASSVENIHTGRVTRVVPSPKDHAQKQRGRGIWARSAQEY